MLAGFEGAGSHCRRNARLQVARWEADYFLQRGRGRSAAAAGSAGYAPSKERAAGSAEGERGRAEGDGNREGSAPSRDP